MTIDTGHPAVVEAIEHEHWVNIGLVSDPYNRGEVERTRWC